MPIPESTQALFARPIPESLASGAIVCADSKLTTEAGFLWPVYFTRAAWDQHVAVTPAAKQMLCDETGRLWDVLWILRHTIRAADGAAIRIIFAGVTTEPRVRRCTLVAFLAVQDDHPSILLVTPSEAEGEDMGKAIDTFDSLIALTEDEEDGF